MLACGSIFDSKYQIVLEVGRGGMGQVYKAFHRELGRYVAIKLLSGNNLYPAAISRLEREALAMSRLHHASIVSVYGFGMCKDLPYLVMEFVEGSTLEDELRDGRPLTYDQALEILMQLCDAIAYTHRNGIVHRDLKPDNIMIVSRDDRFRIKLIDLGLARILPECGPHLQRLTETGTALGTALYMSPEQCMGDRADQRSDVYSLGVILFRCLTGSLPFDADSYLTTMSMHVNNEPPRLGAISPDSDHPGLQIVVDRCLAKNPQDRYGCVGDLAEDLRKVLQGQGQYVTCSAQTTAAPVAVKSGNLKSILCGLSVAALLVGGGLLWYMRNYQQPTSEAVYAAALEQAQSEETFNESLGTLQLALDLNTDDHLIDSVRPAHEQVQALLFHYLENDDPRAVPLVRLFVEKNVPIVEMKPITMTYFYLQMHLMNGDDDLGGIRRHVKSVEGWRLLLQGAQDAQCHWFARGQILQMIPINNKTAELIPEMERFLEEDAKMEAEVPEDDANALIDYNPGFGRSHSDLAVGDHDDRSFQSPREKRVSKRHPNKYKIDFPDLTLLRLNMFKYYWEKGDVDKARTHMDVAYANAKQWAMRDKIWYALDAVAIGLAEMKDWPRLWQCMQDEQKYCIDVYNRDDAAHPLSILALEKTGRHTEAVKLFDSWKETFAPSSKLTEQQYVELVLKAMGETGYTFNTEGTRQRICKIGL